MNTGRWSEDVSVTGAKWGWRWTLRRQPHREEKKKKKKPWKPWRLLFAVGVSQKLKQICTYRTKGPLWHTKTKAKAELWLWEEGLQCNKIGEESKSIPKATARDKPHREEKKKKPKTGTKK